MKKMIICLANSYKEKGRCLAGIEISHGVPLMVNGRPKWIRPISLSGHGEIPTYAVNHVKILDIVEIDVFESKPDGFQTENVSFDQNYLKIVGKLRWSSLDAHKTPLTLCLNGKRENRAQAAQV